MSYTKATQKKYVFILGATRLEKKRALQRIHLGQNINIPGECIDPLLAFGIEGFSNSVYQ